MCKINSNCDCVVPFQGMDMLNNEFEMKHNPDRPPPPIFITNADINQQQQQQQQHHGNFYLNINEQQQQQQNQQQHHHHQHSTPNSPLSTASSPRLNHSTNLNNNNNAPLTVQTQDMNNAAAYSPSALTPTYQTAINTPLPPSPCPSNGNNFLSSNSSNDENNDIYSPRSPTFALDPQQQQYGSSPYHP